MTEQAASTAGVFDEPWSLDDVGLRDYADSLRAARHVLIAGADRQTREAVFRAVMSFLADGAASPALVQREPRIHIAGIDTLTLAGSEGLRWACEALCARGSNVIGVVLNDDADGLVAAVGLLPHNLRTVFLHDAWSGDDAIGDMHAALATVGCSVPALHSYFDVRVVAWTLGHLRVSMEVLGALPLPSGLSFE